MSYRTIAAALALEDLSVIERLSVFSLASFANREHCAWPKPHTAAARAGIGRGQYLAARCGLTRRGLITVDAAQSDAGSAPVRLVFAEHAASTEREVNPALFEAVLASSSARGGARVLLAVLAALGDDDGVVQGVSADELRDAGGLAETSFRRARAQLLATGQVTLEQAGGGRSRCNRWRVRDPRQAAITPPSARPADDAAAPARRPPRAALSLPPQTTAAWVEQAGPARVTSASREIDRVVRSGETPAGNRAIFAGRDRASLAPETPPETPPANARARREPQNQGTSTPPDPPVRGHPGSVSIIENFRSERGRVRQRTVTALTTELCPVCDEDREEWRSLREQLCDAVGGPAFAIWLASHELIAVSSRDRALLIAGPAETRQWVAGRYGPLFSSLSARGRRLLRLADDRELAVHQALTPPGQPAGGDTVVLDPITDDHQEAV